MSSNFTLVAFPAETLGPEPPDTPSPFHRHTVANHWFVGELRRAFSPPESTELAERLSMQRGAPSLVASCYLSDEVHVAAAAPGTITHLVYPIDGPLEAEGTWALRACISQAGSRDWLEFALQSFSEWAESAGAAVGSDALERLLRAGRRLRV